MKKIFTYFLLISLTGFHSFAQVTGDFRSISGGNWNVSTTWQTWNGGSWVAAGSIPTSSNNVSFVQTDGLVVTIPSGFNAYCASLLVGESNHHDQDLVISGTGTLTVSGNLNINRPNAGSTNDLNIGSGTVTVGGNLTFLGTATNTGRCSKITITTGTLNIGVDLILNAPAAAGSTSNQIDMSGGAGILNLGGSFTIAASGGGSLLPGTSSTFNYNGSTSGQTVQIGIPNFTYNNLHLNNTSVSGATFNGAVTSTNVTGNIRVQNGTLSNGGYAVAMAASKTFEVGNNATFTMTGATGMVTGTSLTKIFNTNSTVIYGGTNQSISSETYYHLSTSGSGTKSLAGAVTMNGNLTIGSSTVLDVTTNNFAISVARDWTNNGTFTAQNGNAIFNGSSVQSLGGSASSNFNNLTINNSSGIVFAKSQFVTGVLTFSNGTITTSTANLLTMDAGSSVTGASTSKYIIGPVKKIGNTAFTFPVGKGNVYAPCGISAPANSTDAFTAEYMRANPKSLGTTIYNDQIKQLSLCEYWNLNRTTGTSAVNVTLNWSSQSPCNAAAYVNDLAALTIAHFNGAGWDNLGNNGGTTGNVTGGTVTWNNVSSFSPFTLASTSPFSNPLPVKFDIIKATDKERGILIDWSILTELNIDHYEIERSNDSREFNVIGQIPVTGNIGDKSNYNWLDMTVGKNLYFYRIKAVDLDGKITYSSVAKINKSLDAALFNIFPNPVVNGTVSFQSSNLAKGTYTVNIINNSGILIYKNSFNHTGGTFSQRLSSLQNLRPGLYTFRINNDGKNLLSKIFMVQ